MLTRRRFLTIAAAAGLVPGAARAAAVHVTTGVALGAQVTLRLVHPQAPALAAAAMTELHRLEDIFSLYRTNSALSRLNRAGRLDAPPLELLDCLGLAGAVHRASGGRFDPTVQPLWQARAAAVTRGAALTGAERRRALALVGWDGVGLSPAAITLRPGMALTLNGIAQGYIADRLAALLAARGLGQALIDTGEMVAIGPAPGGGDWPVGLAAGGAVALRDRALATSAPLGMTFGGDGATSHILDPLSGRPAPTAWREISVTGTSAALADAVSTAACLLPDRAAIEALCARFPGLALAAAA